MYLDRIIVEILLDIFFVIILRTRISWYLDGIEIAINFFPFSISKKYFIDIVRDNIDLAAITATILYYYTLRVCCLSKMINRERNPGYEFDTRPILIDT